MSKKICIVGAGPAGCSLAYIMRSEGHHVTLYDLGNRPDLLVGESLIPSVIPMLRRMGIADKVATIGVRKPGAVIYLQDGYEWVLPFSCVPEEECTFAYNVNRKEFDSLLLEQALRTGVLYEKNHIRLEYDSNSDSVSLKDRNNKNLEGDFYVDSTGRARLFSKSLGCETISGPRKDIALFSHLDDANIQHEGFIHINVFSHGWTWRIPLQDSVSVGVVACKEYFSQFGDSREEQYDTILANNPVIQCHVRGSTRKTKVKLYDNYQLRSCKLYGKNWALVGDAAGFIDPTFSGGLHLALYGAQKLADALGTRGCVKEALRQYALCMNDEFSLWETIVNSFYEGGFFSMIRVGSDPDILKKLSKKDLHITSVIAKAIMGFGCKNPRLHDMFKFIIEYCESRNSRILEPISSHL